MAEAYGLTDGVHRCLVAWHLGHRTIRADIGGREAVLVDIPIEKIRSPRSADIVVESRLRNCLRLSRQGRSAPVVWAYELEDEANPEDLMSRPTIPELYNEV